MQCVPDRNLADRVHQDLLCYTILTILPSAPIQAYLALLHSTVITPINYMADSTTATAPSLTPNADPTGSAAFPESPTSIISSPTAVEDGSFLKPANPRKRPRPFESTSVSEFGGTGRGKLQASASAKSLFSPQTSPLQLTAAAEMAEQKKRKLEVEKEFAKQQSPNPQRSALGALLGGQDNGISRPEDAPSATNTLNVAVAAVAPVISIPDHPPAAGSLQTSPVSMSSFGTLNSTGATTTTANGVQVSSPGPMVGEETGEPEPLQPNTPTRTDTEEAHSNKAFTYPGPLLSAQLNDARRGMSLPGSGLQREDSRSPSSSNKKHKCPYCSTEFTRHHNLKSHLLTHSHEKPYMCQTCDARFRRLHDLKRHTKLHTGERPHICPKCKRSFARGDALARHNKGQGGCAGRRSSVGSFGGDGGTGGDESMDGLMYTGEASHEPEHMDDDEGSDDRRPSLPSIRRHEVPPDPHYRQTQESQSVYQSRQPSTYPPVAMKQPTSKTLYPPGASYGGGSSTSTSPGNTLPHYAPGSNIPPAYQSGGSNVFPHGGMTESPKPLSPGAIAGSQHGHPDTGIHRNRSPSMSQHLQQQQFGRRTHSRASPPPMALPPPPMSSTSHSNAPHLPSLPSMTPPDPRFTLHSQVSGPTHGPPVAQSGYPGPPHPGTITSYQPPQGGNSSKSNSHSSHGTQQYGSGERATLPYPQEDRLWALVKALDAKVERLQEEVASLRSQVNAPSHRQ